jgi:hypothetical protein
MAYWLCVETNFNIDKLSPNNGWPFCVESSTKPNYIRVLGPYETDENFLDVEKCSRANIVPYNTEYPDGVKDLRNWTTRGWYAYCPYDQLVPKVVTTLLDYPPSRTQGSKCVGPYDTEQEAIEITSQWSCAVALTPAEDTCDPTPKGIVTPDLECSLVCSSLGWPMSGGNISVTFYQYECIDPDAAIPSKCVPTLNIGLGCAPTFEPVVTTCWNGWFRGPYTIKLIEDPPRGYKIRMFGTMCVDPDPNYVNVSVTLQALTLGVDSNPSNPSEGSEWTSCGTFGGRIPVEIPAPPQVLSRSKRDPRKYRGDIQAFRPSCSGLAECIGAVRVSVQLTPMRFGCDGTIGQSGNGTKVEDTCGLFTDEKTYGCAAVQMLPLDYYLQDSNGTYIVPSFYPIGVNTYNSTGCIYCKNITVDGVPTGAYTCQPLKIYGITEYEATHMGIPGEDTAEYQQIQMFGGVMLKRIANGPLYVAVKNQTGTWIWQVVSAENIIQHRPPMIIDTVFPSMNIRLLFYLMEFPSPELAGCVIPGPYPPPPTPATPSTALLWNSGDNPIVWQNIDNEDFLVYDTPPSSSSPFWYSATLDTVPTESPELTPFNEIRKRFTKTCLYLREEILNTGCCGSSNKYVCEKFGICRKYGRSTDNEPICGTCPEFTE